MGLRIVHVVRQYAPSVGGLETVVARLARDQQRRLGHTVRVVTLDRLFSAPGQRLPPEETIDGVPVTRLSWRGSSRYPLCPQVVSHLGDADLVHVHGIDFFFDWLALTRPWFRKPLVASTHGGFFHTAYASTLKRAWFATITRMSATRYRRIVATSDNDGAVFRRIAPSNTVVVENGAEIGAFRDAASVERVPTLLFFGRWSANKGLPELIAVVAALRVHDPRWRLIVAGRPYDLTAADLRARIDARGLGDAVELHASPSDDGLRALMRRASYFACLSRHEGFGIAAIEAMSAGLVPVLSDIPPFRKVVDASGHGLLLPLSSLADAAADAIAALHRRLGARPASDRDETMRFTDRYEWQAVVDRYDAIYAEAVGRPESPRATLAVRPGESGR